MGLAVGAVAIFPCAAGLCSFLRVESRKEIWWAAVGGLRGWFLGLALKR